MTEKTERIVFLESKLLLSNKDNLYNYIISLFRNGNDWTFKQGVEGCQAIYKDLESLFDSKQFEIDGLIKDILTKKGVNDIPLERVLEMNNELYHYMFLVGEICAATEYVLMPLVLQENKQTKHQQAETLLLKFISELLEAVSNFTPILTAIQSIKEYYSDNGRDMKMEIDLNVTNEKVPTYLGTPDVYKEKLTASYNARVHFDTLEKNTIYLQYFSTLKYKYSAMSQNIHIINSCIDEKMNDLFQNEKESRHMHSMY